MCTTCGCSATVLTQEESTNSQKQSGHGTKAHSVSSHSHEAHSHSHHHSHSDSGSNVESHSHNARIISLEKDILAKNDRYAQQNRERLNALGCSGLNLLSSPGSGKTTLLCKTIERLKESLPIHVIEGDQQTEQDALRIRESGAPAVQINTGKGCHLDAHDVGHAIDALKITSPGLLFIENVGNLVCPAAFDLGEHAKVVMLSVTEGEDKPLKYPDMFKAASLMLINKIDLAPYVDFDSQKAIEYARRINPTLEVISVSATTGEGLSQWDDWILGLHHQANRTANL